MIRFDQSFDFGLINYNEEKKIFKKLGFIYFDYNDIYIKNFIEKELVDVCYLSSFGLSVLKDELEQLKNYKSKYKLKEELIVKYLISLFTIKKDKSDFELIKEQVLEVREEFYKKEIDKDYIISEILTNYIRKEKNENFNNNIKEIVKLVYYIENNVKKEELNKKILFKTSEIEMKKILNKNKDNIVKNKIISV